MSTPQDNTGNTQNDGQDGGQAWSPPSVSGSSESPNGQRAQPGQQSGYGSPTDGGQYGYQTAQPSGYAYPIAADETGRTEKGPAPKEVMRAYYLILAAAVVYLVGLIIAPFTTEVPDMPGASVGFGIGLAVGAVAVAIYVVLAIFIRKGHNWARITATVLAALNVLSTLASLLLLPLMNQAVAGNGQNIPQTSGFSLTLGVIVTLLGVAGVIMTYLKPSRPYFAPQKLGY